MHGNDASRAERSLMSCEWFRSTSDTGSGPQHAFTQLLVDAFSKITSTSDPEVRTVLRNFRGAFEFRSDIPWLGENVESEDKSEVGGLAYAIAYVTSTFAPRPYGQPRHLRLEPSVDERPVDPSWLEAFEKAARIAMGNYPTLRHCALLLWREDYPLERLSVEVMIDHLVAGLDWYSRRAKTGISPDPW